MSGERNTWKIAFAQVSLFFWPTVWALRVTGKLKS